MTHNIGAPPSVVNAEARSVPTDGSALSVDLKSDEVYGLYSQDTGLRCTATAPGGAPVEVTDPNARGQSSPPQVLSLTTRGAGTYRVSCEATHEVVLNTAEVSPARQRAQNVFVLSGPTTIVGLVSAVTGTVWLVRRRRRRAALVVSRPQTGLGADGPVSAAPQAAAAWGARLPAVAPGPSSGSTAVGQGGAGGYGIAPKQVVYRPAPPSDRPGGTAPRR